MFHEAVGLTGLILTKLDGTAKGGIVVRIYQELGVPIKLVGVGEQIEDLQPFDPKTLRRTRVVGRRRERRTSGRDDFRWMARALELAAPGRGAHVAESRWWARVVVRGGAPSARASRSGRGRRTRRSTALAEAGAAGARGDALRHARAVQPPRADAALRRRGPRARASGGSWSPPRDPESARARRRGRGAPRGRRRGRRWAASRPRRARSTARSSPRWSGGART